MERIARNPTFASRSRRRHYLQQLAEDERALVAVTTTTAVTVPTAHAGRRPRCPGRRRAVIAQVRRSTELGLIVLAAIITAGAYALAALGRTATLPANLVPFLVVILGLLLVAHLATRLRAAAPTACCSRSPRCSTASAT